MTKKCAICKKELPDDYKVPFCDYHRNRAKERGAQVAAATTSVAVFVKTNGPKIAEAAEKYGPQVIEAGRKVAKVGKKLLK